MPMSRGGDSIDVPIPNRWVPVVGGVMMNLALGMFYGNSLFLPPVEKEFGWTRGQTSLISTLGIVMIASWFVVGGRLNDRRGPRVVATIGGTLYSLGFLLASQIHSLTGWYLAWILIGIGSGFGYVVPSAVGSKWFPDKRGLVIGLMVAGYGAGSGVFTPIASALVRQVGWRATFEIFGGLFFAMTMIAAYLMNNPPTGYRPPGWAPPQTSTVGTATEDVPALDMVRTRTFWALWVAYALGTTAGVMVISQLGPFASESGHAAAAAAFAFPVASLGNAGGRLISGWMSDHIGRLNTLRMVVLVSAIAMPALYLWRQDVVLFFVLLCVVYYCYGTQLSVYASTSADFYGTRYFGFNYGLLLLAWGTAGIFGGVIAGRVHDATGQYRLAFFSSSVISLVALCVLLLARNPRARPAEARSASPGMPRSVSTL
jgi:OFA family oxalate/formate antiporter-like MFS transporter